MPDLPTLEPREAYALWAASYPPYAHNALMRTEERAMLSLLPAGLNGRNVLDAGCGSGRYLLHARQRGARNVLGVDFSEPMLRQARKAILSGREVRAGLIQASVEALPVRDQWADVTLCALALGHLPDLARSLAELRRVTRPGGLLLCSDFHPIGETLGWPRDFKAAGKRYAVRHTAHTLFAWETACANVGLCIQHVLEPRLDPADIPPGATFEASALEVPVALVFALLPADA